MTTRKEERKRKAKRRQRERQAARTAKRVSQQPEDDAESVDQEEAETKKQTALRDALHRAWSERLDRLLTDYHHSRGREESIDAWWSFHKRVSRFFRDVERTGWRFQDLPNRIKIVQQGPYLDVEWTAHPPVMGYVRFTEGIHLEPFACHLALHTYSDTDTDGD